MMNSKTWIKAWFITLLIIFMPIIGGFNYVVDPYDLYESNILNKPKIKQVGKIRLLKASKIRQIEPSSICLGTSRTEYAYDPNHAYFIKPSYNFATSGSSMYENSVYFKSALEEGNLKKVLLVVDYIMFNHPQQQANLDFESYFKHHKIYSLLFSTDVLKDSLLTLKGGEHSLILLSNGQREHTHNWKNILKSGGHLETMKKDDAQYYKEYPVNYTYKDTNQKSFPHFEEVVELCYRHKIELDIILGPSHIRQWEALDYYLGYDTWLQWKKDLVIAVDKIASQYNKKQFRMVDFSVYHDLTAEKVPKDKNIKMKYHWDSNHYKNELGNIVLNKLVGNSQYEGFGVGLTLDNIDRHLEEQKIKRKLFIDTQQFQLEVWGNPKS